MTTDEPARLHLYELVRQTWDDAAADTLMTALPRDPDRLATKDGLAVLGTELKSDIIRTVVFANIATNAMLVGLVLAAIQLT